MTFTCVSDLASEVKEGDSSLSWRQSHGSWPHQEGRPIGITEMRHDHPEATVPMASLADPHASQEN